MLAQSAAFSGFSVDDVPAARAFYADTLGLEVTEENGMLTLHLAGDRPVIVYPKPDHQPATFTNALGNTTLSSIATEGGTTVNNANGTLTLVPHQQVSGGSIGASGQGIFTNAGNFITQHTGSNFSSFTIGCSMFQGDGSFKVQGQSTNFGTVMSGGALFTGGEIIVNDNANLRFHTGAGSIYEFDGLGDQSIRGGRLLTVREERPQRRHLPRGITLVDVADHALAVDERRRHPRARPSRRR